ncbi:MAG: amidohydrolase family protein [Roseivirga sp.]|nr:amidohydrolase family protein [Roseivirga sp.]
MKRFFLSILLVTCWACSGTSAFDALVTENNSFDIAIMNGRILDGTGAEAFDSDLLIRNGKIVFIGEVDSNRIEAENVIDAGGKVVTPGFIDVHAHGNPLSEVSFQSFLANGTTTILLGQDGYHPAIANGQFSILPWMEAAEKSKLELNVALFAGHGSLRREARIPDEAVPTEAQMEAMLSALRQALEAGAFGMSTGLEYVPGMYAQKAELEALARVLGEYEAVMSSHMRNEDDDAVEASIKELLDLGKLCQVHASHLKVVYGKGAARGKEILTLIDSARQADMQVSADVYPYIASYTGIGILFPKWAKTQGQFEQELKTRRKELETYLYNRVIKRNGPDATLFGSGKYAGKTLAEAAEEEGITYVELLLSIGPQGASGAYFIMDRELQDTFITDPEIMIASDGSPTMLHPRGHGTMARIIEQYVIKEKSLTLASAVHKMSGFPAKTMGITDRGLLQVGLTADILVFKPEEIKEKATFSDPYQLSEGFDQVIVNGKLAMSGNKLINGNAGLLLKK